MNLESLAEAGERLCGPDIGRDDTSATAHHRMGEVTQDGLEIVPHPSLPRDCPALAQQQS